MKKKIFLAIMALAVLLPLPILAGEMIAKDAVIFAKDKVVNGNYYAAGKTIEIYGEVNGDLFLAGEKIIIDSDKVNGDVFIAGRNITVKQQVNGSVRVAGENLELSGQVRDNVLFFGSNLIALPESRVGGHLSVWGAQATISGEVGSQVEGGLGLLVINGKVGGDVNVHLSGMDKNKSSLQVTESAVIGGSLNYTALAAGEISEQAQIAGGAHFSELTKPVKEKYHTNEVWELVVKFFMMLVVGMILVYLWPKLMSKTYTDTMAKPIKTILWGLVFLILTPLACVLLMITFIGLPVAFMVLALWLIYLYVAQIIAAWLAGNWLKEKMLKDKNWSAVSIMALGIAVYIIIGQIPVVGWLIIMLLYLAAWGNIRYLFNK